jgi:ppGpp synthetase/RelA/SpoT-type nucleotidyltranferase
MQKIIDEFDHKLSLYTAFTEKIRQLIVEILTETGQRVHSVSARVKDRGTLAEKITRSDTKYTKLTDVTDLAGIRIITFFDDDVGKIADITEKEFQIDKEKSVDKKATLDPDRFGYISLHYIVKLPPSRTSLIEYQRFPDLFAEIQIRSILQHAWAEIEHDLGYKTKLGIPKQIQRRFSRLAGLLELADQEFMTIRDNIQSY